MFLGRGLIAILPTGFGNSLLFQLFPRLINALQRNAVSKIIVVTPLVRFLSLPSLFRSLYFSLVLHYLSAWNRLLSGPLVKYVVTGVDHMNSARVVFKFERRINQYV